jgi:hypothetical protein
MHLKCWSYKKGILEINCWQKLHFFLHISINHSIKLGWWIDPIYWISEIEILYCIVSNLWRQHTALTFSATYKDKKLDPFVKFTRLKHMAVFTYQLSIYTDLLSMYIMMRINFSIIVRVLQYNKRGFPLIFTITVVK